ncbi:MAG: hypothetical protein HJJLKODD_01453 [Phycisphaerae bacterium]|nr:hypothetical protein [Phycisphaerae bacterium]
MNSKSVSIVIRPAASRDLEIVVRFNLALAWESEQVRLDAEVVHRGVELALADASRASYWLAELDEAVVGQLMITREWSDWRAGYFWWIQSVYVLPDYRRRGVFRALYQHVEEIARQQQEVCGLRLYVEHENHTAMHTYTALGMQPSGHLLYEVDWRRSAQIRTH